MKIIYAGTPDFAVPALNALIHSNYPVVAVYTQPDRPAGRGKKLLPSPIKQLAEQYSIPVQQPIHFRDADSLKQLESYNADIMIVAAYGIILPTAVLDLFPFGCINIHASILPRWRGAAPVQRAIIAGDTETGISIMQMEKGLDTGPFYCIEKCPITAMDTGQSLLGRLANLGATTLMQTLPKIFAKSIQPVPQNPNAVTYAHKLEKAEGKIIWQGPAELIQRKIRAFNSWPVAFCEIHGERVRVWQAEVVSLDNPCIAPGTLISVEKNCIHIACGQGGLSITQLQFPGGKVLSMAEILHAKKELFKPGLVLC